MSGEEDEKELELKDLIVQTLEANGLLSKIKAQLRASVFMALDENDKEANKDNDFQNIKVKKLLQTNEGRLAASLIRDFLECCNLDYTISVLDPELNSNIFWDKREKLCKTLNIYEENSDIPILSEYLKTQQSNTKKPANENELPQNIIDSIRAKFNKFDTNKKGALDKDKTKSLFINLFPTFSKNVIEKFILDEIDSNDLKMGSNFDNILFIYKKLYKMCVSVTNHENITSDLDDPSKFGNITNRGGKTSRTKITDSDEDDDDSISSNSSSAFKRNDKFQKEPAANKNNVDALLDTLKPGKRNDDFFNFSKNDEKQKSTLGDLPPLNNSNNFQNKFFNTSNSKDSGKFKDMDDYDDDFTNGTPRTPKTDRKFKNRSALGSDDEIEDNLSYVDESSKVDEITIDRSISTVQGNNDADYIEDLSI